MKSITIHGIDNILDKKISEKSRLYGLSQNKTVKKILCDSLLTDKNEARKEMFSDLFGTWTAEEKVDFDNRIKDFESINKSDWE